MVNRWGEGHRAGAVAQEGDGIVHEGTPVGWGLHAPGKEGS